MNIRISFAVFLFSVFLTQTSAIVSSALQRRSRQLTTIFENGRLLIDYGYAEDLFDGRGVTFGIVGFTTKNGDGRKVIDLYKSKKSTSNPFDPFLSALRNNGGDGINSAAFIRAVKLSVADQLFKDSQEQIWNSEYWRPSQVKAASLGLQLALSKAIFYDTWVQHGEEDEPGCCLGTMGIVRATNRRLALNGNNEKLWMNEFLRQRRYALNNAQGDTQQVWMESTSRIDIFQDLAKANAWLMDKPISIGVSRTGSYFSPNKHYGSSFYIF